MKVLLGFRRILCAPRIIVTPFIYKPLLAYWPGLHVDEIGGMPISGVDSATFLEAAGVCFSIVPDLPYSC
jgi:hypothetical protein